MGAPQCGDVRLTIHAPTRSSHPIMAGLNPNDCIGWTPDVACWREGNGRRATAVGSGYPPGFGGDSCACSTAWMGACSHVKGAHVICTLCAEAFTHCGWNRNLPVLLIVRGAAVLRRVALFVGLDPHLKEAACFGAIVHLLRSEGGNGSRKPRVKMRDMEW